MPPQASVPFMLALSAFLVVSPVFFLAVSAHIAMWTPSMFGFNVTAETFPYDNRPVVPLAGMTFDQWWFHGHKNYPPHPEDVFELPAGQSVVAELACDKGATSYFASSPGGNIQQGDWPCPGQGPSQFHTLNVDDTKGCALAIAPVSNVNDVQPEDFVVFSVNHACVWNRHTSFQVPADMPPCPPGGCLCTWNWIHDYQSGSMQIFQNGFQCKVTGSKPNAPALSKPQVARRCGADPDHGVPNATPSNCTQGAKQPLYWYQKERNNMFEGTYAPPFYNLLYDFKDGAQNDIFVSSGSPASSPSSSSSSSSSTASSSACSSTPESSTNASTSPAATPTCREHPGGSRRRSFSAHARRSRAHRLVSA